MRDARTIESANTDAALSPPGQNMAGPVLDVRVCNQYVAQAQRYPRDISGGESQRTALARTLVTNPSVLLLDEPLAALDASTKATIIEDLRVWNRAHRIPILYVTHSREEVFALGERVLVLDA